MHGKSAQDTRGSGRATATDTVRWAASELRGRLPGKNPAKESEKSDEGNLFRKQPLRWPITPTQVEPRSRREDSLLSLSGWEVRGFPKYL